MAFNYAGVIICLLSITGYSGPAYLQSSIVDADDLKALPLIEQCAGLEEDSAVVSKLISALSDADPGLRAEAASGLGRSCRSGAVGPLISALRDESTIVRIEAARALARLGDRRAIEPLIDSIGDRDWKVRAETGRALCSFQIHQSSNAALNVLVNPTDKEISDEGDLKARCLTILAINQLRDVRFSRKALGFLFFFLDMKDEKYRRIAEQTANELKHTRNGFHELVGIVKQHNFPDFRRKAAKYLATFDHEMAREVLEEVAAGDRDVSVQRAAREALASMKK